MSNPADDYAYYASEIAKIENQARSRGIIRVFATFGIIFFASTIVSALFGVYEVSRYIGIGLAVGLASGLFFFHDRSVNRIDGQRLPHLRMMMERARDRVIAP